MARVVREWTLLEEVGRGGMGVVYSATHEILTGAWAVKVIRPELSEDKESRLRFLQEASILARMQHSNIVATQTPFLEAGQIYLPMEYLSGQSLEQILKTDGSLWSAERAVNIIRQVAAGLGYAHRQSPAVLHRDIKPGNIQVLDDGGVKVLDFGLARTLGDKSMTGTGKAVGTPAYMAPEVLEGRKASPRSDIYSLGVVLYRLLAGRLPYDMPEEDSSIQAVFMAVARGLDRGLPDVREFAALTPTALANLTMSTLSRASEGRPADGADLAGLLGRVDTRPLLPKSQNMAEFSADSTRLGIDLNSVTGKKPAMDNGSGIERSSPTPGSVKIVPKQEDADSSLIGLDLHSVRVQRPERPVHPTPVPVKADRKVGPAQVQVETERKADPVKVVEKPVDVLWEEPTRTRTSRKGPVVLKIVALSVLFIVVALVGWWTVTKMADTDDLVIQHEKFGKQVIGDSGPGNNEVSSIGKTKLVSDALSVEKSVESVAIEQPHKGINVIGASGIDTDPGNLPGASGRTTGAAGFQGTGAWGGRIENAPVDTRGTLGAKKNIPGKSVVLKANESKKTSVVSAGSSVGKAEMDPEIVRRYIQTKMDQVRWCYQQEVQKNPDLAGQVKIEWIILATGKVTAVRVAESSLGNTAVEHCLASRVASWQFPSPKGGGSVKVAYPFVFKVAR